MWIRSCFFIFVVSILVVSGSEEEWNKFKKTLGTKYSATEDAQRKKLFLKADANINRHNSENHTWKMKHSPFSVMTKEEKEKRYGMVIPEYLLKDQFENKVRSGVRSSLSISLPQSVDFRKDPCMAPVKNQNACGSCWAFSAINPIEFSSCKRRANNQLILLSEQHFVDCGGYRNGCNGSFAGNAYEMLSVKDTQRVAASSKYPYEATFGACRYTDSMKVEDTHVIDWVFIDGDDYQDIARNMMEVLNQNITLSVGIHVRDEIGNYGSGIYTPTDKCDYDIQHAIAVVGYGTMDGIDYWIIRNSWGITWGDSGYAKMRRGVNQCRIEDMPLYPILVD